MRFTGMQRFLSHVENDTLLQPLTLQPFHNEAVL